MGILQNQFLAQFQLGFENRFGDQGKVLGGQRVENVSSLPSRLELYRDGRAPHQGERFELGDLRIELPTRTVIVEFDADRVGVGNLLKYWPYLRGELSVGPHLPILLCHFSSWSSNASSRHLWDWLYEQMIADREQRVGFVARQFDHCEVVNEHGVKAIVEALDWVERELRSSE